MKPLLFFHHLCLWKDSDNLLGDVCVCVCVCVGRGVHIMYLCKIWGGGLCSTVLSETLIQLQIFDFCCSKEQNTVYFTHSQTHPW